MNKAIPIVILATAVLLFFFYTEPKYSAVTGSADNGGKSVRELLDLEGQYSDALSKTEEIKSLRDGLLSRYNSVTAADLDALSKLVPDSIDEVRLVNDINNTAAEYGMSIQNINYSELTPDKSGAAGAAPLSGPPAGSPDGAGTPAAPPPSLSKYATAQLSFSVSGSYEDFRGFVKALEDSLRILDIFSVSIGGQNQGRGGSSGGTSPSSGGGSSGGSSGAPADFYTFSVTVQTYHLKK